MAELDWDQGQQPEAKQQARILTMLPKAAASHLAMIDEDLAGDARAAAKGRVILRDMIGDVSLWRGDLGSLWATYKQDLFAVVRNAAGELTDTSVTLHSAGINRYRCPRKGNLE
jgi:hypothetical protein